jgi:tetratricopeptide (TPR) repeat protein
MRLGNKTLSGGTTMRTGFVLIVLELFLAIQLIPGKAFAGTGGNPCENYLDAGNYKRAIDSGIKAVRKSSKDLKSQICLGMAYNQTGDIQKSIATMKKAEELATEKYDLSTIATQLGHSHFTLGNNDEALLQYQRALTLDRQLGDNAAIGGDLSNISNIYDKIGELPSALHFLEESISYGGSEIQMSVRYCNLAMLYCEVGNEKCLDYYDKAIAFAEHAGDYHRVAIIRLNLGNDLRKSGHFDKASGELEKGIVAIKKIGDRYWEAIAYDYIARLYRDTKNVPDARIFYQKALAIYQEIGAQANIDDVKASLGALNKQFEIGI